MKKVCWLVFKVFQKISRRASGHLLKESLTHVLVCYHLSIKYGILELSAICISHKCYGSKIFNLKIQKIGQNPTNKLSYQYIQQCWLETYRCLIEVFPNMFQQRCCMMHLTYCFTMFFHVQFWINVSVLRYFAYFAKRFHKWSFLWNKFLKAWSCWNVRLRLLLCALVYFLYCLQYHVFNIIRYNETRNLQLQRPAQPKTMTLLTFLDNTNWSNLSVFWKLVNNVLYGKIRI